MTHIKEYPRVLIIYHSCINKADQHGVSIRGWFADWPKGNLAQIYSGGEVGQERFCEFNFKLSFKERRFGNIFNEIKKSSFGQSSYIISMDDNYKTLNRLTYFSLLKSKISSMLLNTGLWELIFKPKLSNELLTFVSDFNPQIIYCQGYNLTFSWLPVMLHNKLNLPICFQTGDDWPNYLYSKTFLSFLLKPIINKAVFALLSKSTIRLANGNSMLLAYNERYGIKFETLYMCDNLNRFREAIPKRIVESEIFSIIYSGNLGQGRWQSILDICESAKLLSNSGFKIMITCLTTTLPPEAINRLIGIDNLQILPGPSHEELPSYLKGADLLFLPESFDSEIAEEIRLSISTKAHFYMMSEIPILVYASPITGVVNYATEEGWAYVVRERSILMLSKALHHLLTNERCRSDLVKRGIEIVTLNHMEEKVRARFLSFLIN